MAVVWLKEPLTPVIVIVVAARLAVLAAVKVTVLPVMLIVTPGGGALALRVTAPVNPPTGVTVIVLAAVPPCATETLAGFADSEKSGVAMPGIVRAIVAV